MKEKLKNVFFILLLGSASTSLLLGIENYTLPKIKEYEELKLKATILEAAGVEYSEDSLKEAFRKNIREERKEGFVYYLSPDNFPIFKFRGRGLWGMIEGIISLSPDLETIRNIRIISHEETPGLGGRISEEGFLNQFQGKKIVPGLILVLRRKATEVNEVDGISGASITVQSLVKMINESALKFRQLLGK